MQDLTPILIHAKNKLTFQTLDDFLQAFYSNLPTCDRRSVTGDIECGDHWVFAECASMFHICIGVAFFNNEAIERYKGTFQNFTIIPVDDFDEKKWCVDLDILKKEVPELGWMCETEAVDPSYFSVKDLYFVTV